MAAIKFTNNAPKYYPLVNIGFPQLYYIFLFFVIISLMSFTLLLFYFEPTAIKITLSSDNSLSFSSLESKDSIFNVEQQREEVEVPPADVAIKETSYTTESMACHLPKLDPFDKTVMKFHKLPDPVDCTSGHPLMFATDHISNLIIVEDPSNYNFYNCCYSSFQRKGSDLQITVNPECISIVTNVTVIPEGVQFIQILCANGTEDSSPKIPVDLFGIIKAIPSKHEMSLGINPLGNTDHEDSTLKSKGILKPDEPIKNFNVVVLGLDSLSHMNFMRIMPKTHAYLTHNLSAIGFSGYVKVGDNTFPNLASILTGKTIEELNGLCWKDRLTDHFDECPFVWNNYSARGYRTAFGEDSVYFGAFTYCKEGFINQPTDYYYNPLTLHLEKFLGHTRVNQMTLCYGPRLGGEILFNYLEKVAFTMNKTQQEYFQFVWATSSFHGNLCQGNIGDEPVLKTLRWFETGGYLEDTILMLMSDHGMRWGDIRSTLQGRLEENMPFLYLILPKRFKQHFPSATQNLINNQRKLTTHFDLHETLQDLSDLGCISDSEILTRSLFMELQRNLPRGISLFLPIPHRRTCEDAGIADQWCVCADMKPVRVENNTLVSEGARSIIEHINTMLIHHPQCVTLTLQRVLNSQFLFSGLESSGEIWEEITSSEDPKLKGKEITLIIAFSVSPSNATFEATSTRGLNGIWRVTDEISRTNLYGEQSSCVQAYELKKFCYCDI